jgi:hypothetical protein
MGAREAREGNARRSESGAYSDPMEDPALLHAHAETHATYHFGLCRTKLGADELATARVAQKRARLASANLRLLGCDLRRT